MRPGDNRESAFFPSGSRKKIAVVIASRHFYDVCWSEAWQYVPFGANFKLSMKSFDGRSCHVVQNANDNAGREVC